MNQPAPDQTEAFVYEVSDLDCPDCALSLERAVGGVEGVAEASLNFTLARLTVTPELGSDVQQAVEAVARQMGHGLQPLDATGRAGVETRPPKGLIPWLRHRRRAITTGLSGVFLLLALGLRLAGAQAVVANLLYATAIVVGGLWMARAGLVALVRTRSADMNVLMTLAAVGAMLIGEWEEGAVVVFLFAVGNLLESATFNRARNAIRALMTLSPQEATLVSGERVPVEKLRAGDQIVVRPGGRIPMDGVVEAGESAVNQAPITGESVPVDKAPGDVVFAGTVNGAGALTVRVTRLAGDNTLSRIIQLVEQAQAQRAPAQRWVDRFARRYTPIVIAVAAGVAFLPPLLGAGPLGEWFYRALVLLVIACPCALVISTPVSVVSAIASAARSGVLIKGGAALEALGGIRVVAFDKTGTLTRGAPEVVDIQCIALHSDDSSCTDCDQVLADAAAVEALSEHPLARAVVSAAEARRLNEGYAPAELVKTVGRAVIGRVNGRTVTVGHHGFLHENGQAHDGPLCEAVDAAQARGETAMVVHDDRCGVRGYIAVADTLRSKAPGVINRLRDLGIRHVVMLTGDNPAAAQTMGRQAGVDEVRADLLPQDKLVAVDALLEEYGSVAMVGDGVNDAPALARASVGIAMGAAGSDTALETADLALMGDDLDKLPFAIGLSRRARGIIIQNVGVALALKAIFLALALAGIATLWMAVFADMGASLLVTLNGMRLLRTRS
jgi:Cd2+/Zn2+-exporting ATPase